MITGSALSTELCDTNTSDGSISGLFWVLDNTGVLLAIVNASPLFGKFSLPNLTNIYIRKQFHWYKTIYFSLPCLDVSQLLESNEVDNWELFKLLLLLLLGGSEQLSVTLKL